MHSTNLLILDEPTNHLDSEMVTWLEQYLIRLNCGLIMVTHDRYFLESVVTRIVELSRGQLYSYDASYSGYLQLKAQRGEMNEASERKRQSLLRLEYQWIMQGPKARGTKSRERTERYEALLAKDAPERASTVLMSSPQSRLGRKIIELSHIRKSFGERLVIDDFSYIVLRDDRIGIVGANGAGKSTLLNIIAGLLPPDEGNAEVGSTVKLGYFMQECRELDFNQRVYDFICSIASEIKTDDGVFTATQMLERFLFDSDLQYMTIGRLSGGERRRLYLLSILMEAPNILLLDEPTNDLDIETLTILEDYLESFSGAVLAVSHDRYFLDKVASSIFEVTKSGKINCYNGNYADYIEKRQALPPTSSVKQVSAKAVPTTGTSTITKTAKLKFTFNEQQEYEVIDDAIAELEAKIETCANEIIKSFSDYLLLQSLTEQRQELEKELALKTDRWLYLHELEEKIELAKNTK